VLLDAGLRGRGAPQELGGAKPHLAEEFADGGTDGCAALHTGFADESFDADIAVHGAISSSEINGLKFIDRLSIYLNPRMEYSGYVAVQQTMNTCG
jgi:hypothetical protein